MTEQTREIFVVMGLSVDGDRVVTYGAYTSMDAAQIKRQFVMSDFGKEVWVDRTLLQLEAA
jgi:hypothetical protein